MAQGKGNVEKKTSMVEYFILCICMLNLTCERLFSHRETFEYFNSHS